MKKRFIEPSVNVKWLGVCPARGGAITLCFCCTLHAGLGRVVPFSRVTTPSAVPAGTRGAGPTGSNAVEGITTSVASHSAAIAR